MNPVLKFHMSLSLA